MLIEAHQGGVDAVGAGTGDQAQEKRRGRRVGKGHCKIP